MLAPCTNCRNCCWCLASFRVCARHLPIRQTCDARRESPAIDDGCVVPFLVQVEQATHNAHTVQQVMLALLCVEGVGFMVAAVITIIRLLRGISVHRLALFSVFLAVPHTFLRTLASKSVSIGIDDGDGDEGELRSWSGVARAVQDCQHTMQAIRFGAFVLVCSAQDMHTCSDSDSPAVCHKH